MADNMIELVASINEDESIKKIQGQLNKIAPSLNLEIKGSLSSETIETIRGQLKNLNVSIGGLTLDNSNITSVVSSVQNSLSNVDAGINIPVKIDESSVDFLNNTLENLGANKDRIKNLTDTIKELDIVVTKIKPKFVELAGSGGDKVLDSISISGIDKKTGNIVNIINQTDELEGKVAKTTYSVTQNLAEIQKANKKVEDSAKTAQLAYNDFLKLKGQADVYSKQYSGNDSLKTQLEDIQKLVSSFDNTQPIEKQREGIIRLDNALKLLKVDIESIQKASTPVTTKSVNDYYPTIAKIASTDKSSKTAQLNEAKTTLNDFFKAENIEDSANRIKRAVEDTSGELQRFYVQVEKGDKSVETLTYALNKQGTAYEYVGKTIREADNSTDFRRKDLSTQWSIQSENLKKFAVNADKAGLASTALKEDIKNLYQLLNNANPDNGGNTSTMNAFLDDFDIAKAKLQAFNAEIRKENAIINFNNKIKKLSADMNTYAAANQRAIESTKKMTSGTTFADEWTRLTGLMAKGTNLTDTELRNLTADMAVFKKESKAAGLEGASAFERFANSFKIISTYISANQIINRAISKIREAVTELKEIDNILTEISKTSDRTTESLKALGEASFDVASKYGRTASDYLLGVQEMSRAGFGELQSEQLAELSLRAQAAGDMTADMANQYIIATNAAYALEGNEEKLNKVLDAQNYITNHNAVNMENLAQATKIAASQASASGVAIDELTAAVGTMVAVTQQGGDQAGRAFKGILMNIQQVKASAADIGDGGEDITAESLSKYEKASAALGVALKEVKNGTLQLREPMEVLRDLAEAVSKESEGSIKVANLISAVGGKFRGNQLIALLKNWETYEKMLSEFNSDKAIGSAMDEAEKSANNWAGSINKVKNSWAELTSKFANSDNMISILNSINTIIQSITDSATTGALSTLSDIFTGAAKAVSFLVKNLGALPTLLTTISAINSIRGKGIFGSESIDSLTNGVKTLGATFKGYITKLKEAKISTVALKVETVALEAAMTFGITFAISALVEGINKLIHAQEIAEEEERKFWQTVDDNVSKLEQEETAVDDLIAKYSDLIINSENNANAREDLVKLQDQMIKDYGSEAEAIDLVNGKYSEQIKALQDLKKEKAEAFIYDENNIKAYNESLDKLSNAGNINGQIDVNIKNVERYNDEIEQIYENWKEIGLISDYIRYGQGAQVQQYGFNIEGAEDAETLYKTLEKMAESYKELSTEAGNFNESQYAAFKQQATAAKEYYDKYKSFVDLYEQNKSIAEFELPEDTQKQFDELIDKAKELYETISGSDSAEKKFIATEKLRELKKELYEISSSSPELTSAVDDLFNSIDNGTSMALKEIGSLREAWLATYSDMEKGSLKNISTMVSALQELSEGKGIAAKTFWNLIEFDTEGFLNGAKLVGDKFFVTQENMIKLKDEYIKKEIQSLESTQANVKLQKDIYDELVSQYELEVAILQMRGTNPLSSEMVTARSNLEKAKRSAKEFGDEWERNNWLIEYLNQTLGNTVDLEKELQAQQKALNKEITALNKELDDLLKAQEHQIDAIVKGLEIEQTTLENQKQDLEDELDVLEKQKDVLEEIVGNYDKVNTLVQNTLQKEIDALEAEKDSIEEAYKKRIDALKEENEQRSDALEYAQKLANLENAKNNKVRVIDETRGFRYESKKEDVVKAEKELKDFENERQIKQLEKERDAEIKVRDERIKNIEAYAKDWKEMAQEVTDAQTEIIAQELLGSDWREEITNLDIETLETFRTAYATHNADLEKLTNGEIKLKKAAIDAKDAEINAKKKQIDVWKDYKKEVQNAVQTVKNEYSTYMTKLGTVYLTEKSNLEDRESNLTTFTNNVTGLISQITDKQGEVDRITASLDNLEGKSLSVDVSVQGQDLVDKLRDTLREVEDYAKGITIVTAPEVFELMGERGYTHINEVIQHWRNSAPQKITAPTTVTRKGAPNVSALQPTTNTSNVTVNIDKIVTDSPADFAKQLDQYCRTKLTSNYTRS